MMDKLVLLQEYTDNSTKSVIVEGKDNAPTNYYIEGVFMQSGVKNQNNRTYPHDILSEQVDKYNSEFVLSNRALGELDHPPTPIINLKNVSHKIEELKYVNETDVFGRARLIDTPMGNIAKSFIREGIELGVSSRALGKAVNGIVGRPMILKTIDIVSDPSAKAALVTGIMEGREWIIVDDILTEESLKQAQSIIDRTARQKGHIYAETSIFDTLCRLSSNSKNL